MGICQTCSKTKVAKKRKPTRELQILPTKLYLFTTKKESSKSISLKNSKSHSENKIEGFLPQIKASHNKITPVDHNSSSESNHRWVKRTHRGDKRSKRKKTENTKYSLNPGQSISIARQRGGLESMKETEGSKHLLSRTGFDQQTAGPERLASNLNSRANLDCSIACQFPASHYKNPGLSEGVSFAMHRNRQRRRRLGTLDQSKNSSIYQPRAQGLQNGKTTSFVISRNKRGSNPKRAMMRRQESDSEVFRQNKRANMAEIGEAGFHGFRIRRSQQSFTNNGPGIFGVAPHNKTLFDLTAEVIKERNDDYEEEEEEEKRETEQEEKQGWEGKSGSNPHESENQKIKKSRPEFSNLSEYPDSDSDLENDHSNQQMVDSNHHFLVKPASHLNESQQNFPYYQKRKDAEPINIAIDSKECPLARLNLSGINHLQNRSVIENYDTNIAFLLVGEEYDHIVAEQQKRKQIGRERNPLDGARETEMNYKPFSSLLENTPKSATRPFQESNHNTSYFQKYFEKANAVDPEHNRRKSEHFVTRKRSKNHKSSYILVNKKRVTRKNRIRHRTSITKLKASGALLKRLNEGNYQNQAVELQAAEKDEEGVKFTPNLGSEGEGGANRVEALPKNTKKNENLDEENRLKNRRLEKDEALKGSMPKRGLGRRFTDMSIVEEEEMKSMSNKKVPSGIGPAEVLDMSRRQKRNYLECSLLDMIGRKNDLLLSKDLIRENFGEEVCKDVRTNSESDSSSSSSGMFLELPTPLGSQSKIIFD